MCWCWYVQILLTAAAWKTISCTSSSDTLRIRTPPKQAAGKQFPRSVLEHLEPLSQFNQGFKHKDTLCGGLKQNFLFDYSGLSNVGTLLRILLFKPNPRSNLSSQPKVGTHNLTLDLTCRSGSPMGVVTSQPNNSKLGDNQNLAPKGSQNPWIKSQDLRIGSNPHKSVRRRADHGQRVGPLAMS